MKLQYEAPGQTEFSKLSGSMAKKVHCALPSMSKLVSSLNCLTESAPPAGGLRRVRLHYSIFDLIGENFENKQNCDPEINRNAQADKNRPNPPVQLFKNEN